MKVIIDMENLESLLEKSLDENINTVIKEEVDNMIHTTISSSVKAAVDEISNKSIESYINDYIKTAKVKTGGGLYSKEEEMVYTVEEYLRKKLSEILESKTLIVKERDYVRDCFVDKEVTFEEFIKRSFDFESIIKQRLTSFSKDLKYEINAILTDNLNETTKNAISETLFELLNESDNYKKIVDKLKCFDKK